VTSNRRGNLPVFLRLEVLYWGVLIGICATLLQRACKKPHGQTELSRLSWPYLKAGHVNGDVKWLSALLNRIPSARTNSRGIDFFLRELALHHHRRQQTVYSRRFAELWQSDGGGIAAMKLR
jgi:hypothetical protein